MKFYIAGRFPQKDKVREVQDRVREKGHEITADWTSHDDIKDFFQQKRLSEEYALEDVEGVRECEVFVLIGNEEGRGSHLELGVALASNTEKIYVIGQQRDEFLFYFHPEVERRESIDEVLEEI